MEKGIHLKFKNFQALYFNPVGLRISIKKGKLFPKNLSTFALCLLAKNKDESFRIFCEKNAFAEKVCTFLHLVVLQNI